MAIVLDGTNGITAPDGSAASPAYKQQDANTGISGSADQLVLSTAGTERIRVASAGQLGIAGANYGTDGQVLTSTGASSAPAWETISAGTTRTTANASASSGTEIEFTSLDADAYWHRILFFKVSTDGNTDFRLQAGTSSAYLTSNYKTSCGYLAGGSSNTVDGDSGWIRTDGLTAHADTEVWEINFMRAGTTNNWIVRGTATQSSTNYYYWITSNFELSAALAKIKIYPVNNNFDAGNIYLESFK